MEKTTLKNKKPKKVRCIYCDKPIHISKFGGMNKKGMFCNRYFCMLKLIEDEEKEEKHSV